MIKIIFIGIAIIFSLIIGFAQGYFYHKKITNDRAIEMIMNDEIPNNSMEIGTLDYILYNEKGELKEALKK